MENLSSLVDFETVGSLDTWSCINAREAAKVAPYASGGIVNTVLAALREHAMEPLRKKFAMEKHSTSVSFVNVLSCRPQNLGHLAHL